MQQLPVGVDKIMPSAAPAPAAPTAAAAPAASAPASAPAAPKPTTAGLAPFSPSSFTSAVASTPNWTLFDDSHSLSVRPPTYAVFGTTS